MKSGYTSGSTKTIYGNARRKLQKMHGEDSNAAAPEGNGSPKAKKPRKSTVGRKRKRTENEIEPERTDNLGAEEQPTNPETDVAAETEVVQEQEA